MILICYTPTPHGEAALERAIHEARTHETDLVVLNVARGEAVLEANRLYDEPAAELVERLDACGLPYSMQRRIIHGQPAEAILDVVDELDPQMLVIGLRKRSATGKLLFGSTAQRLLLDAPCDVLSVKATSGP